MTTHRLIPKRFKDLQMIRDNGLVPYLEQDDAFYHYVAQQAQKISDDVELNRVVADYIMEQYNHALKAQLDHVEDNAVGVFAMDCGDGTTITLTLGQARRRGFEFAIRSPKDDYLTAAHILRDHLMTVVDFPEDLGVVQCQERLRDLQVDNKSTSFGYVIDKAGQFMNDKERSVLEPIYALGDETPVLLITPKKSTTSLTPVT